METNGLSAFPGGKPADMLKAKEAQSVPRQKAMRCMTHDLPIPTCQFSVEECLSKKRHTNGKRETLFETAWEVPSDS